MQAQQINLDVVSNNLANVNTTGFKKSSVDFQSLFYQTIRNSNVSDSTGLNNFAVEVGNGVKVAATRTAFTTGSIQATGNPMDVAIEGNGFFMVQQANGHVGFTRAGAFRLDHEGYLVNPDGCRLLSSKGNVSPENSTSLNGQELKFIQPDTDELVVTIASDGTVNTEKEVATPPIIELAYFTNPDGLAAIGASAYEFTPSCGEAFIGQPAVNEQLGLIRSECLEASNVSIVDEMVKMIMAQRAYEIGSKAIQSSDEMLGITNGLKR